MVHGRSVTVQRHRHKDSYASKNCLHNLTGIDKSVPMSFNGAVNSLSQHLHSEPAFVDLFFMSGRNIQNIPPFVSTVSLHLKHTVEHFYHFPTYVKSKHSKHSSLFFHSCCFTSFETIRQLNIGMFEHLLSLFLISSQAKYSNFFCHCQYFT